MIKISNHVIDFEKYKVSSLDENEEIIATENIGRIDMGIIKYLYENKGVFKSKKQIIDAVWDYEGSNEAPDIDDTQVTKHISAINILLGYVIENRRGVGYRWPDTATDKQEQKSEYRPFDGLRNCLAYLPNAKYVDVYTQMGGRLFTEKETSCCFDDYIKSGIKFRIIINSPEAATVTYSDGKTDYIEEWYGLSSDIRRKNSVSVRVSNKTFHERLFLVYESEKSHNGIANIRDYHYSTDLSQAKTRIVTADQENYKFYINEFNNLWKDAKPISDYYNARKARESWERRLIEAYEEKERNHTQTYINILQNLSEEGYSLAENRLACCYIKGQYVKTDEERGIDLLRKAADKGNRNSIFNLGMCYWFGYASLSQDYEKAVALFHKLSDIEQPDGDACFYLYLAYRNGYGVACDFDEADYYRRQAQNMGVTAQNTYGYGLGMKKI